MTMQTFTKAKHYHGSFTNGIGTVVPVSFTVLSKISDDGQSVYYCASFFATDEKVFKKKVGVAQALENTVFEASLVGNNGGCSHDHPYIMLVILRDMYDNSVLRSNMVPFTHMKFLERYLNSDMTSMNL